MRRLLLPVCLVAVCLAAGSHAWAEDAAGCDMLCRVTGYLTSDHMAAAPGGAETPHGVSAKPHRSRAAARKTAASTPVDKAGMDAVKVVKAAPSTVVAVESKTTAATSAAAKAVVAKVAPTRPAPARVVSAKPARPKPPTTAAATPRRAAQRPLAELTPPVAPAPRITRAASVGHRAKVSRMAALPPAPPRTQTAAALIPGSAPTMPAGFQPLGSPSFH